MNGKTDYFEGNKLSMKFGTVISNEHIRVTIIMIMIIIIIGEVYEKDVILLLLYEHV